MDSLKLSVIQTVGAAGSFVALKRERLIIVTMNEYKKFESMQYQND
jgi:hypothetical protein